METDISVLQTLQPGRAYSVSCEREAKKKVLDFPEAMRATSMGCKNRMKRVTVGVFKVEEWQLPQGRLLEVSMPGSDTPQDLALFMAKVKPLLDKGVVLVDRSKSQAGSSCSQISCFEYQTKLRGDRAIRHYQQDPRDKLNNAARPRASKHDDNPTQFDLQQ